MDFQKVSQFAIDHINEDPFKLRLSYSNDRDFYSFAIDQIECRRKFKEKLPSFVSEPLFMFPSVLAGEQSSNEFVARYNSQVGGRNLATVADLTSGLGIDAMAFARAGASVTAFDIESHKSEILEYNVNLLGLENFKCECRNSIEFLSESSQMFDLIFADPARRGAYNRKLVSLHDCSPDVVENYSLLASHSKKILLKLSPMLDISVALSELPDVTEVHAVSFKGECKELLVMIEPEKHVESVKFVAVDIDSDGTQRIFEFGKRNDTVSCSNAPADEDLAGKYLFVPNASVMKISRWNEFAVQFPKLKKASVNTHIFIGDSVVEGFPGKVYSIERKLGTSELKKLKGTRLNVISRNFPKSAEEIRRNFKLLQGQDKTLIALRIGNNPESPMYLLASFV